MTTLHITGMTCQNCVKHVTQALQGVDGVEKATVDLAAGTAVVEGSAKPEALIAAVEEEGYEVRTA
jgi:copper chaperone CopZ